MEITDNNTKNNIIKHIEKIKSNEKVPKFTLKNNAVWAWCCKVVDGDTIHACFFINNKFLRFSIRLSGINTPELSSKNIIEKQRALDAKNFLSNLILNQPIYLILDDFDKYGRLLGNIYLNSENNENSINQMLIANGYADIYT